MPSPFYFRTLPEHSSKFQVLPTWTRTRAEDKTHDSNKNFHFSENHEQLLGYHPRLPLSKKSKRLGLNTIAVALREDCKVAGMSTAHTTLSVLFLVTCPVFLLAAVHNASLMVHWLKQNRGHHITHDFVPHLCHYLVLACLTEMRSTQKRLDRGANCVRPPTLMGPDIVKINITTNQDCSNTKSHVCQRTRGHQTHISRTWKSVSARD